MNIIDMLPPPAQRAALNFGMKMNPEAFMIGVQLRRGHLPKEIILDTNDPVKATFNDTIWHFLTKHRPGILEGNYVEYPENPDLALIQFLLSFQSGNTRRIPETLPPKQIKRYKSVFSAQLHSHIGEVLDRLEFPYDYETLVKSGGDRLDTDIQLLNADNRRFTQNFREGLKILDGFKEKIRATGEPTADHSKRVWLRFACSPWPVPLDNSTEVNGHTIPNRNVAYVSMLAAMLHDCVEDLDNFTFTHVGNSYMIQFVDSDGKSSKSYRLNLGYGEADLLRLQLEALTKPPMEEESSKEEKTLRQFEHLFQVAELIEDMYGPFAAYLTYKIKNDDRVDNLLTYFPNSENPKERKSNFPRKVAETYTYFEIVQMNMDRLADIIQSSGMPYHEGILEADRLQSALRYAKFFLLGGNYDIFRQMLDLQKDLMGTEFYERNRILLEKKHLLVPQLPPFYPTTYTRGIFIPAF